MEIKDQFTKTIMDHQARIGIQDKPELPIHVHFRSRPINDYELSQGYFMTCFCQELTYLYVPAFNVLVDCNIDVHSYPFTSNNGPDIDQAEFLNRFGSNFDVFFDGISCIFAYGQTGSGKTYTMNSVASKIIQEIPDGKIKVSLLEILGEHVVDLTTKESVKVLVDGENVVMMGLSQVSCQSKQELSKMIEFGFEARKSAKTLKNDHSSRSHFICKIQIEANIHSEILLVDLAGSERNADSKFHSPERIKESRDINSSLMALKECLRARAIGARVPYRNSKLTTILKQVLCTGERKSQISMIATCSPTIVDISHSLDTFRYACSLNSIKFESEPVKSTPMAWKVSKIAAWISNVSNEKIKLESLVEKQQEGRFIAPIWKQLYELEEREWEKRTKEPIANFVRLQYRSLFVRKRPVIKSSGLNDGHVESVPLLPNPSKLITRRISRQEEAMLKAKAKGILARKKSTR